MKSRWRDCHYDWWRRRPVPSHTYSASKYQQVNFTLPSNKIRRLTTTPNMMRRKTEHAAAAVMATWSCLLFRHRTVSTYSEIRKVKLYTIGRLAPGPVWLGHAPLALWSRSRRQMLARWRGYVRWRNRIYAELKQATHVGWIGPVSAGIAVSIIDVVKEQYVWRRDEEEKEQGTNLRREKKGPLVDVEYSGRLCINCFIKPHVDFISKVSELAAGIDFNQGKYYIRLSTMIAGRSNS